MAVGSCRDGAVAIGAIQARSFRENALDCLGAGVAKWVRFTYRYGRNRGVNGVEKRRSAGSFSAVVRHLEKIRGEIIAIRQNTSFDSPFDVSGEQK